MGVPQIIMLCVAGINLLLTANLHGKPREDSYNFWVAGFGVLLQIGILYWGGFFRMQSSQQAICGSEPQLCSTPKGNHQTGFK